MTTEAPPAIVLRDLSCAAFARVVGMSHYRAAKLLRSGDVPTAYETEGKQLRVAVWGVQRWQERRGQR